MATEEDGTFELADARWPLFLQEHGYAVIRSVASTEDVEKARAMFWEVFEQRGVLQSDTSTWSQLGVAGDHGILFDGAMIQSNAAWFIRGLPKIHTAFERIWETADLIVSMDSTIAWLPWWLEPEWRPHTEGLHLDQNPFQKPGLDCVQGMVPLYDVTPASGGLEVCPDSHLPAAKKQFCALHPQLAGRGQFLPLPKNNPLRGTGKLLQARAGDLILWDSRTIHGGKVGTGEPDTAAGGAAGPQLARLAQTVCMTPRARASIHVLEQRQRGPADGLGFNHCPHEANVSSRARKPYTPPSLSADQLRLL